MTYSTVLTWILMSGNWGEALDLMPDFWRIDKTGFADELLSRLNNAGANSYFIGNSANHFIPCNLRPNWKVFIDTLALKAGRMLKDSLV